MTTPPDPTDGMPPLDPAGGTPPAGGAGGPSVQGGQGGAGPRPAAAAVAAASVPPVPAPATPPASPPVVEAQSGNPWDELAAELTPAKSLARLDAATGRVVSNVSVVATLLTGFGLLAAGLPAVSGVVRGLAVGAVVAASVAVGCGLAAQVVTVSPDLQRRNRVVVRAWYRALFRWRAPMTWAASVLLIIAAGLAGTAAVTALAAAGGDRDTLAVSRTAEFPAAPASASPSASASALPAVAASVAGGPSSGAGLSTVVVEVSLRGVEPGASGEVTVSVNAVVVAQVALVAGADGVVSRSVTVAHVPDGVVVVRASAGARSCAGRVEPGRPVQVHCPA